MNLRYQGLTLISWDEAVRFYSNIYVERIIFGDGCIVKFNGFYYTPPILYSVTVMSIYNTYLRRYS